MNDKSPAGGSNPFDVLMNAAVDAIIITDSRGRILQFNRAAQTMFAYRENEVIGQNVSMLMPDASGSRHDEFINHYLETGQAAIIGLGREETGMRSDGSTFPIKLSVGEIKQEEGKQGEGSQFVGIIHDLSDQKAAEAQVRDLEAQLLHADRLVILGELTAGIAHEINQPLTAIAAYADAGRHLVERSSDDNPDHIQLIYEKIGEQSRRAAEVVQRLRKLVRTGVVSKVHHDINQIINNTLLLFEYETKKHSIELEFYPDEDTDVLHVDEIQIQQILVNLVKNALDAINSAGQDDGRITIRVKKFGTVVAVEVQDNGPGVSQDNRRKLFESFFTTKPTGVGLGLSICKHIAAAHGGNLRYESPVRGGSRFTLTLPMEQIG